MVDEDGIYMDLRECADFRPMADCTATDATTPAAASTDPSSTVAFTCYSSFRFPKPEGDFNYDATYYLPRRDEIAIKDDGTFEITQGRQDNLAASENPNKLILYRVCLLYTSPSPRDQRGSRMPSSA